MKKSNGFAIIFIIAAVIIVGAIVATAILINRNDNNNNKPATTNSSSTASKTSNSQTGDPYAGWKSATSSRAQFSIKYPSDWTYSSTVGSKDNVEHILISSSSFEIKIDSYHGTDATNGGTSQTTCPDCKSTVSSQAITISKLGSVNMETAIYTLDNGTGNALILRQNDGTYYITSPSASAIKTTFRGISILDSEQAYQNETSAQFSNNADLATAKEILRSISY